VILACLALLCATASGPTLAQRFQGGFTLAAAKDKPPRAVLGFREFHGEPGHLISYSLESGGAFFDWLAPLDRVNYGRRVGAIGDLDGDGFEDVAVGCSVQRASNESPIVELHSGRNGDLLGLLEPELDETAFGECIAALPDLDGDGKPEFLVGANMHSPLKKGSFAAYAIYSGATRARLGRIVSESTSGLMQGAILLLPGPADHPWAAHATGGSVLRMDLRSMVVEQSFVLDGEFASGQVSGLCSLGDQDGDGHEEVLLALNLNGQHRWLELDGKSWTQRKLPASAEAPAGPLAWLARAGDLDGDGTPDFVGERTYTDGDLLCAFSGKSLACLRKLPVPADLKPLTGGPCGFVHPAGMPALALATCCSTLTLAGKRGVYVFDWEKGALLQALGPR